jgi:hypothetical protein
MMDAAAHLSLRPAKRAALRSARQRLSMARSPVGLALGAALPEPLTRSPRQWAALLLLAALPLLAVLALARGLIAAWQDVVLWWAPRLGLPLERGSGAEALVWRPAPSAAQAIEPAALAWTALAVLVVFTASLWIGPRQRGWRHLLWGLCAVQLGVLLLAAGWPAALPVSPTAYLATLLHAGLFLMLALPLLLAFSLSGQGLHWAKQLACMAGVLVYFALLLPHKLLLLALLLQPLPMLWAPLLFLLVGALADLLLLVALLAGLSLLRPPAPGLPLR